MKIIDAYSWFYDLFNNIRSKEALPLDEINLLGGRRSAKSISVEIFAGLCASLKEVRVAVYFLRSRVSDSRELYNEVVRTFEDMEINVSHTQGSQTIKIGNNIIRVIGMNSMDSNNKAQKAGLANAGKVDYIITVFEEAFQFKMKDILAIKESIRSTNKNVEKLTINVCNPWSRRNEFIIYCSENLPWNTKELQEYGYQFLIKNIEIEGGYTKRALFMYSNWRVAKSVVSVAEIKEILNEYSIDKNRARTADLGLPGYEDGSIYNHLIPLIGEAIYAEHDNIRGGLDWGWGNNSHSSKTSAVFLGATLENSYNGAKGVDLYDVYVSDNRKKVKPNNIVYREIIDFFWKNIQLYVKNNNLEYLPSLTVRVDYQNAAVIQALNDFVRQLRINWLNFIPCSKKVVIVDRIEITRYLMSIHYL
ncbi:MAG: hypothetical protein ACRCXE_01240, partial [Metamycoplasmataceae bacterium]